MKEHIRCRCRRRGRRSNLVAGVGVISSSHVVDEETIDVREEVIVGEEVLHQIYVADEETIDVEVVRQIGVVREASSRVRTLPKNLIAPLPYRITRGEISEAYYPVSRCTPEDGMERSWMAAQGSGSRQSHVLLYVLSERNDLSVIEVGDETNSHPNMK